MAVICPTVTALEPHEYRAQMEVAASLSKRVHIDLMDGQFAPTKSPSLEQIWWPHDAKADIHLMYQLPATAMNKLIELKPELVIIHAEAQVDHKLLAAHLHKSDIKAGLALLADTSIESAEDYLHSYDHILIFSGHLGFHGGEADLSLLEKVKKIKHFHPTAEIGWDGGINDHNVKELVIHEIDVLNIGGFIQSSSDPSAAYAKIKELVSNKND